MVDRQLITAQELAKALNLSVETIWRYTRDKKIPAVELSGRQYRYRLSEVMTALTGAVHERAGEYQACTSPKLTYDDYLALPDETGFRVELLDGLVVKDPSANVLHQRVSRRLQKILEDYFRQVDPGGEVFNAPLDLTLSSYTVVQPDLFYISGRQQAQVLQARVDGAPALVVEILSPSSARKDRLQKLRLYRRAGVEHYWLVDPEAQTFECFALTNGLYAQVAAGMEEEEVSPEHFSGLTIHLRDLWGEAAR